MRNFTVKKIKKIKKNVKQFAKNVEGCNYQHITATTIN